MRRDADDYVLRIVGEGCRAARVARCAIFMEFLYPAPLSSLEFICGIRDIRTGRKHFLATRNRFAGKLRQKRTSNAQLRSRLCLRRHWRGGLCRHGALSERLRQLMRAAMTFDTILGAIVTAVVMIYLVIALIRPERF
jgi:K+-transporting ATPase KdpF subunit